MKCLIRRVGCCSLNVPATRGMMVPFVVAMSIHLYATTQLHAQTPAVATRQFRLGSTPTLVISDDGSEAKQFVNLTVRQLKTGELAVGDQVAKTLRLFSRNGRVMETFARPGKGPGELSTNFQLSVEADTVFLFSQALAAASIVNGYARDKGFVGSTGPLTFAGRPLFVVERLQNGDLLVRNRGAVRAILAPPPLGTLISDTVTYGVYKHRRDRADTVSWFAPIVERWYVAHTWPNGRVPTTFSELSLAGRQMVIASGQNIWLVDGAAGQYRILNAEASVSQTWRIPTARKRIDAGMLIAAQSRALKKARTPMDSVRAKARTDRAFVGRLLPMFDECVAGADGEIWMRRFQLDDRTVQVFVAHDRTGRELAELRVPPGIEIQQMGRDFVLALRRDEDGVISIVEYALTRR